MKVTVNQQPVQTDAATMAALVAELGLPIDGVAVAADGVLVPRSEWAGRALKEGMAIVVVRAACGG